MNNFSKNVLEHKEADIKNNVQSFLLQATKQSISNLAPPQEKSSNPFIFANTFEASLSHLQNDCIIPVFSKDNEKTIAHQEFIEVILNAVQKTFSHYSITEPEIRVSHQIKG